MPYDPSDSKGLVLEIVNAMHSNLSRHTTGQSEHAKLGQSGHGFLAAGRGGNAAGSMIMLRFVEYSSARSSRW